jgi:hypothetical protein
LFQSIQEEKINWTGWRTTATCLQTVWGCGELLVRENEDQNTGARQGGSSLPVSNLVKSVTKLVQNWYKTGTKLAQNWYKTGTKLVQNKFKTGKKLIKILQSGPADDLLGLHKKFNFPYHHH